MYTTIKMVELAGSITMSTFAVVIHVVGGQLFANFIVKTMYSAPREEVSISEVSVFPFVIDESGRRENSWINLHQFCRPFIKMVGVGMRQGQAESSLKFFREERGVGYQIGQSIARRSMKSQGRFEERCFETIECHQLCGSEVAPYQLYPIARCRDYLHVEQLKGGCEGE